MRNVLSKISKNIKITIKKNGTTHTFITGDSLEVLKLFPENSIDLIITDPPYNLVWIMDLIIKTEKEKMNISHGARNGWRKYQEF